MQFKQFKGGLELVPENLDDLWLLSELIKPRDFVKMPTTRKVKKNFGERVESEKRKMTLKIRVEKIGFHEYDGSLRVSGEIVEGPEDIRGSHSFSISTGKKFKLFKELSALELEELNKSRTKKADVVFILVDREEALIAHGNERTWIRNHGYSKTANQEDYREFFGQIKKRIDEIGSEYVVIAGPGEIKDLLSKEIDKKVIIEGASSVSESGLKEVLVRGALERVGSEIREVEEAKAVERIFENIRSGKSFYGFEDSQKAIEENNVQELLVSKDFIEESIRKGKYAQLRELIEKVKYAQGKIMLVGRQKEALQQLNGLGGVAGIKRW